jgi:hypothetical protein
LRSNDAAHIDNLDGLTFAARFEGIATKPKLDRSTFTSHRLVGLPQDTGEVQWTRHLFASFPMANLIRRQLSFVLWTWFLQMETVVVVHRFAPTLYRLPQEIGYDASELSSSETAEG